MKPSTVRYFIAVNRIFSSKHNFLCTRSSIQVRPLDWDGSFRHIHVAQLKNAVPNQKYVDLREGIFKRAWSKIKFHTVEKSRMRVLGYYLYESIADKINYISFFKEMEMPDTFNSWFVVTELHVWMLMVKAMEMSGGGRLVRNYIVEAMWGDVSTRGKKLGPENISAATEQVLVLGDQFQAALIAYDEGLLSNDQVLASSLWRRFFNRSCEHPEKLEAMVQYVRHQMQYLDNLSEDDFKKRKIKWISLEEVKV